MFKKLLKVVIAVAIAGALFGTVTANAASWSIWDTYYPNADGDLIRVHIENWTEDDHVYYVYAHATDGTYARLRWIEVPAHSMYNGTLYDGPSKTWDKVQYLWYAMNWWENPPAGCHITLIYGWRYGQRILWRESTC